MPQLFHVPLFLSSSSNDILNNINGESLVNIFGIFRDRIGWDGYMRELFEAQTECGYEGYLKTCHLVTIVMKLKAIKFLKSIRTEKG